MSYSEIVRPETPVSETPSVREPGARARDRALFGLVLRYREHPSPVHAQAILAFVGETMRGRANRYKPILPLVSRTDIRQELIAAVLETAATIPLDGHEFLERRLVLRAGNKTSRVLLREVRTQAEQEDLRVLDASEEEEDFDEH